MSKPSMALSKCLNYVAGTFAVVTMLAVFVPFSPELPVIGNEGSWRFALNQAVAQGLVFGTDIVYTYGPYASIFTKYYHPATDRLMLGGSGFVALCYAVLLIVLAATVHRPWMLLVYTTLCAGIMYSHEIVRTGPRDALLYSYPLLLALLTYRVTSDSAIEKLLSKRFRILFLILFLPLGLLPLVKSSFALICGTQALCCALLLLLHKMPKMAAASVFLPAIFSALLWLVAGQPLVGFPAYFVNMGPIISGYTESMSIAGNFNEIAVYSVASIAILCAVLTDKAESATDKTVALTAFALFLFIAFKEGFVRHDRHAVVAGTAIGIAALGGSIVLRIKPAALITMLVLAALACGYIESHYVAFSPAHMVTNVLDEYRDLASGLAYRAAGRNAADAEFNSVLASIKQQVPLPPMQGTIDIYSYGQIIVFANGLRWLPRPIFQSYQAYTAELAKRNADHLLAANAPDNIVFRVEPIDGRLPALEDGPTWPLLINNYVLVGADASFLYLKKRGAPAGRRPSLEIAKGEHVFGSEVPLPATNDAVFAEIDVEPTFLGKAWATLYKLPELRISVALRGSSGNKDYRFIPGMAEAGFVISPIVTDNSDFILLTAAEHDRVAKNAVKSFAISSAGGDSLFWNKTYSVKLTVLDLVRDTRIREAKNSFPR